MADQDVNVSVADDHLGKFDEVVKRMEQAGLKVQQRHDALGIVSGSIPSEKRADLDNVPGVASVEASQTIQLPPPDSKLQ
jgi:hypothetical protein